MKAAEASRGRSLTEGNNVSSQQLSGGKRVRKHHTHVLHVAGMLHVNLKKRDVPITCFFLPALY